jgi:hypothetical protein
MNMVYSWVIKEIERKGRPATKRLKGFNEESNKQEVARCGLILLERRKELKENVTRQDIMLLSVLLRRISFNNSRFYSFIFSKKNFKVLNGVT